MSIRFTVNMVWDLAGRRGILATGMVREGRVRAGMTLHDEETGQPVRVLALEFLSPREVETGERTILLDRRDAADIVRGSVLVD